MLSSFPADPPNGDRNCAHINPFSPPRFPIPNHPNLPPVHPYDELPGKSGEPHRPITENNLIGAGNFITESLSNFRLLLCLPFFVFSFFFFLFFIVFFYFFFLFLFFFFCLLLLLFLYVGSLLRYSFFDQPLLTRCSLTCFPCISSLVYSYHIG